MNFIFYPRIVTDLCDCILAHTSAVAQQLGGDTSLQNFTAMHL